MLYKSQMPSISFLLGSYSQELLLFSVDIALCFEDSLCQGMWLGHLLQYIF